MFCECVCYHANCYVTIIQYIPGGKDRRASTNTRQRMRGYCSRVTVRYRSIPPQTVHFRFDRKLENHGVASTLHALEPSEPRLQHARSRSTISFIYRQNTIVPFISRSITLIVTRLLGTIEREPHATAETAK